jgi:hypothetical protein
MDDEANKIAADEAKKEGLVLNFIYIFSFNFPIEVY